MVQKNQYSSFGKILSIKNKDRKEVGIEEAVEKSFAYTGREWDKEIDLYYYRARNYDPQTGRFMSLDPIGLAAGDTNLFRYVQNNPINYIDPYGLDSYRTNAGHGYLVIDDPRRNGGRYVFTFGPKNPNIGNYLGSLIGLSSDAEAEMFYLNKNDPDWFLGIEVAFSRIKQDALADQMAIHRALDFIERTNNEGNYYNLYGVGEGGFNCIGAAREVQCGNQCGGR